MAENNNTFSAEELKARFNPEGSQLRNMQHRMTEMVLCFDEICQRNNIPYWLCSGTLLGQVRHGGYIPWDDDLDVEILREDYPRLMEALKRELPENYVVQNEDTDDGYFFCFAKLRDKNSYLEETNNYDRIFKYRGIFIDIFTFEKFPPLLNWIACRAHGFCYRVMKNPRLTDDEARRRVRRILWWCNHLVFPILRAFAKLSPTKELRYSPGIPYANTTFRTELFPLQRANFDGHLLNVPRDTHGYLKRKFGNYMQLPDLSNIHPHAETIEIR